MTISKRGTRFAIPRTELFYFDEADNTSKPMIGSNGAIPVTGVQNKVLDAFQSIDQDLWDVKVGDGDFIEKGGNTSGSGYIKISKGIYGESETVFTSKFIVRPAFRFALGMSLSQRLMHQKFSIEIIGVDSEGNEVATVPLNNPVSVTTLSQTAGTLTVTTAENHGFAPADRISLYGSDSRFSYGDVYVATVVTPKQFTVTSTVVGALPSLTANATIAGYAVKVEPFDYGDNAMGVVWEGTSANNAKLLTRTQKSVVNNSVDTSMGTGNTNATVAVAGNYADAFNPSYLYDIRYKTEGVIVRAFPIDSTGPAGGMIKRSQAIPDISNGYKIRIRAKNNKGMSKVVGGISNASKTGTTTTTITTDKPHGLTVADTVQIYGLRDQVAFANLTTATLVSSVVNDTTFTIVMGTATTASTKGGAVIKVNGSYPLAPSPVVAQSISASENYLTVVGNTTWSGFVVGETIELTGLFDTNTGDAVKKYEGSYKVVAINTTSLILSASRVITDSVSINVGGAVIKRTDMRLHLLRVLDYTRQSVEIDSSVGNTADYQEALPVNMVNFSTAMAGTVAHDGVVSGAPVRIGAKALTANTSVSTTGDVADLITTLTGALITRPYTIPESEFTYAGTAITNTTDVVLKVALLANRNYLTGIQIQNSHATVGTEVVIKDGTTVIWRGYSPANSNIIDINFNIPLKTTANTALNFACITTGANVYVNAQGYQAP